MDPSSHRSFASDNNAPVAPEILQAIAGANLGDAGGYGHDAWTARATERFRQQFGDETSVYLTFNGTGANVAALSSLLQPWEAVLAPASAHLQTDECSALERFSGSKVIPISTRDGKLRANDIEPYLYAKDEVHFPQPRAISISQATEFGDVYEIAELRGLCAFAHDRGLIVHMDGARIANAAVALGTSCEKPPSTAASTFSLRRHEERHDVGGSDLLFRSPVPNRRGTVRSKAVDAARIEDALPRRAVRSAARNDLWPRYASTPTRWRAALRARATISLAIASPARFAATRSSQRSIATAIESAAARVLFSSSTNRCRRCAG